MACLGLRWDKGEEWLLQTAVSSAPTQAPALGVPELTSGTFSLLPPFVQRFSPRSAPASVVFALPHLYFSPKSELPISDANCADV